MAARSAPRACRHAAAQVWWETSVLRRQHLPNTALAVQALLQKLERSVVVRDSHMPIRRSGGPGRLVRNGQRRSDRDSQPPHWTEDFAEKQHCRLVSVSDMFVRQERTKMQLTWDSSVSTTVLQTITSAFGNKTGRRGVAR